MFKVPGGLNFGIFFFQMNSATLKKIVQGQRMKNGWALNDFFDLSCNLREFRAKCVFYVMMVWISKSIGLQGRP